MLFESAAKEVDVDEKNSLCTRRFFVKSGLVFCGTVAMGAVHAKESIAMTEKTMAYHAKMGQKSQFGLHETDPEFSEFFEDFAFDEVASHGDLDEKTRFMAILAVLLGCQGEEAFRALLPAALKSVSAGEVKEILYQSVAYCGIGRILPFFKITNEVFSAQGIALPLEKQSTTTRENRREQGTKAQVDIFGEGMREFWKAGPSETRHINYWLAANCFGDYYTRKGLDYRKREMITFCFIAGQGGCEPQLTAHAKGNFNVGNDRAYLISVISQCVPYIGYPRTLNALRCINEAAKAEGKK